MKRIAGLSLSLYLVFLGTRSFIGAPQHTSNGDINIAVHNGSVLLPVLIDGKRLSFLVDTGSTRSSISEALIKDLNLQYSGTAEVVGNYGTQTLQMVRISSLRLGNSEFKDETLAVANLDLLARTTGVSVDGVLGNDVLKDITFKISFSQQIAQFGPAAKLGGLSTPIKLAENHDQFFVPTTLMTVRRNLLLDTGTNSTNLSSETWKELFKVWIPKSVIDGIASSAHSSASAFLVCLPEIGLGNVEVRDQAVRVQSPVSTGVFSEIGFSGILGSDILRQFEVTFDLGHSLLFLERDPAFRPDPYKYVTIGIQFAKDSTGAFTVISVWKNSPAAEAGMIPGDRIVGIDGESAGDFTLEQFSARLHAEAGTPIKLKVERANNSSLVTVKTRKLLC